MRLPAPGALARFSPVWNRLRSLPRRPLRSRDLQWLQILCEAGLCQAPCIRTAILHFIAKHITVRVESSNTPFTTKYRRLDYSEFRLRIAEGNYVCDAATLAELQKEDRIIFRYCDADGKVTDAAIQMALAITLPASAIRARNVLGLMPHPSAPAKTCWDRATAAISFVACSHAPAVA